VSYLSPDNNNAMYSTVDTNTKDDGDGHSRDNDDNSDDAKKEEVHKYILHRIDRMLYIQIHQLFMSLIPGRVV
jgi:hypothetical protein